VCSGYKSSYERYGIDEKLELELSLADEPWTAAKIDRVRRVRGGRLDPNPESLNPKPSAHAKGARRGPRQWEMGRLGCFCLACLVFFARLGTHLRNCSCVLLRAERFLAPCSVLHRGTHGIALP
jgi:hypothetical protein